MVNTAEWVPRVILSQLLPLNGAQPGVDPATWVAPGLALLAAIASVAVSIINGFNQRAAVKAKKDDKSVLDVNAAFGSITTALNTAQSSLSTGVSNIEQHLKHVGDDTRKTRNVVRDLDVWVRANMTGGRRR